MRGFGSDNHAAVHPELMAALEACNTEHAPSYGTDEWSEKSAKAIRTIFGPSAESFFVFNGTAANALTVRAICKPWQAILCTDLSHLNVDECGAPEFFSGAKLICRPSLNGKFQLADLKQAVIRKGDQHYSQIKAISITQPTELGTTYSLQELKCIIAWAKSENLLVHMDGARLYNAADFLNVSLKELTADLGVDILSLGGTKNGFMFGEAVILFNHKLCEDFKYIRKQSAQLPSKTRYIAAQFLHFFSSGLWKKIARHSCQMADLLYKELEKYPEISITQKREANAVFAIIPKEWIKVLREVAFFYIWDEKTFECRLMTSWDTSESDIKNFSEKIKQIRGAK